MKIKTIALSLVAHFLVLGSVVFAASNQGGSASKAVKAEDNATPLFRTELTAAELYHTRSNNSDTFTFSFAASYTSRTNMFEQAYLSSIDPDFIESEQVPHSNPEDIPVFEGFVSSFRGLGSVSTDATHDNRALAVIPRGIQVTTKYIFSTDRIISGAAADVTAYNSVFGIFIPKEVTTIEAGAFNNVPDFVTFYCEAESEPQGWEAGWTDSANIQYGVDISTEEGYNLFKNTFGLGEATTPEKRVEILEDLSTGVLFRKQTATEPVPTGKTYSVGFVTTVRYKILDPNDNTKLIEVVEDYNLPLLVDYKITNKNGTVVDGPQIELPVTNVDSGFDGVGNDVGSVETSITFSIPIEEGQTIDSKSLKFSNIYALGRARNAKRIDPSTGNIVDDLASAFTPYADLGEHYILPSETVKTIVELKDLTDFKAKDFSTFGGYTQINFEVSNKAKYALKKYMSKEFEPYEEDIAKGTYFIRFRFIGLFNSKLSIKLKGDANYHQVVLDTPTEYDYLLIGDKAKGNRIGFLFKNSDVCANFDANNIEDIKFLNMNLKAEVVKNDGQTTKAAINLDAVFAIVNIYSAAKGKVKTVDLVLVLVIVMISYTGLFIAAAIALYFYRKNKYKNDEFRRMKTKKYVIAALKNYFEFFVVTIAVTFIIFRTAIMNSQVVMFNPLDVYVVAFSVVALIFVGLTIKDIVVAVKQSSANKKKKKLRLDEDKVEDGTN